MTPESNAFKRGRRAAVASSSADQRNPYPEKSKDHTGKERAEWDAGRQTALTGEKHEPQYTGKP